MVRVSFKKSVLLCLCVMFRMLLCVCCVFAPGLWCPSMRGGVVDGDQGEGGCRRIIPDSGGGVRWSVFGTRRIGERLVFTVGNGCSCPDGGETLGDAGGYFFWSGEVGVGTCVDNIGDSVVVALARFGVVDWGGVLASTSCQ